MTAPLHDWLDAFADGALEGDQAEEFRLHLAACAQCQARLSEVLQLRSLEFSLREAKEAPGESWWQALALRRFAMVGGALAALAVTLVLWPRPGPVDFFADLKHRPLEARLSWTGAQTYRPYEVLRSSARRQAVPVPLKTLAALEERGDLHGVGVGQLLRGELEQAADVLGRGPDEPGRLSDLAVVALERGQPEQALALVDEALQKSPQHPQALWNRALALEALSLDLSAADAFFVVAGLGEPGWAAEARERAETLRRRTEAIPPKWLEAWQAGVDLALEGKPMDPALVLAAPSMARNYFYQAVWAAPSAERVLALVPLAKLLDEGSGSTGLSTYVAEVATHDFRRRGPLAERFAQVLTGYLAKLAAQGTPLKLPPGRARFDVTQTARFLEAITAAKEDDLLLGALPLLGQLESHFDAYDAVATRMGGSYFTTNLLLAKARQEEARGSLATAEANLLLALERCGKDADYRRLYVETGLAQLYLEEHRVGEARSHGLAALRLARAQHEPTQESLLLHVLGVQARLVSDFSLARAYFGEEGARKPGDRVAQARLHEELAVLNLFALNPKAARADLEQVEGPLGLIGAMALADLTNLDLRSDDVTRVRAALESLRAEPHTAGQEAILAHIEAKTRLAYDRPGGEKALRAVVRDAERVASADLDGQKARAYSYSALLLSAGEERRFDDVLALFAEEARGPTPPHCVVGLEENDGQLLVAARGDDGVTMGLYQARLSSRETDVSSLVRPDIIERLRPCRRVEVFARNGLHGQANLLPPELAWSFRTDTPHPIVPPAEPRQLIVSEVEAPPSLRLPPLRSWQGTALPGRVELHGAEATPRRVLGALGIATEVQFHTHGLVNLGATDASLLALSPDADGDYALTAQKVRATALKGAPVVVLAACKASRSLNPSLAAPWSLPVAFIEAGARAVFASEADIPDGDAGPFFDAVLGRIRGGQAPSEALRDERAPRLKVDSQSWVRTVVLFEGTQDS